MDAIKNLRRLKTLCIILANVMMVVQIMLIVFVLLLSTYAFLQLLHNTALNFLEPVVLSAKSWVHFFFGNTIKASQPEIDGELVIFIVLDIILIFVIAQLKTAFRAYDEQLDKKIVEEKAKLEEKFNKSLADDLHRSIASNSCYMLGCTIKVAPLSADSLQIYGTGNIDVEKIESEVLTKFVGVIKNIHEVKLLSEDNYLLLTSSKFDNIDKVLSGVQDTIQRLKKEYRAKRIIIKTRLALETYKPMTSNKKVLASVKPLLDLNLGSDALCFGNFKNRYAMVENPQYYVHVKGKYDMNNVEETIYALVRKEQY